MPKRTDTHCRHRSATPPARRSHTHRSRHTVERMMRSDDEPLPASSVAAPVTEPDTSGSSILVESEVLAPTMATASDPRLPPIPAMVHQEQRAEWSAQFLHSPSPFFARAVRRSTEDRGLRGSTLRSVYWKLYLDELDRTDIAAWSAGLAKRRNDYVALCKKHRVRVVSLRGPAPASLDAGERSRSASSVSAEDAEDLKLHNPLSQSKENPWTQYFHDNELSETIRHDLTRTYADQDFFVANVVQDQMFNILFCWSKEIGTDADGRYRQGMADMLAPILLVCMRESQWKESWAIGPEGARAAATDAVLSEVLDRAFVEHDVYHLFCRVMAQIGQFFIKVDTNPRNNTASATAAAAARKKMILAGDAPDGAAAAPTATLNAADQTPIVRKCHYIHHILLSTLDPQLYAHLNAMDVQPNLYILRWYRVMLSREFHLEDVITIWDVVFATMDPQSQTNGATTAPGAVAAGEDAPPLHSNAFVLTEFMCIAMLLYVRSALLQGDNIFCLRRLLRYPPVEDVRVLLARALHFLHSWKMITSDPTLTREVFDPTQITDAERGNLNGAFDGPWQTISEGMGADAPLESNVAHKKHGPPAGVQRSFSQKGTLSSPRESTSSAQSAKSLIQDGFSSLKSFVKGAVAKASELPAQSSAPGSSPTSGNRAQVKRHATLPANNGIARKAPQGSASHFLTPASLSTSPPVTNSSASPPVAAPRLSPPTAKEHDELVLLRKQLRAAEKERDDALTTAHAVAGQMADVVAAQKQMGALMEIVMQEMNKSPAETPVDATVAQAESKDALAVVVSIAAAGGQPVSAVGSSQCLSDLTALKEVLLGNLTLSGMVERMQSSDESEGDFSPRDQLLHDIAVTYTRQRAVAVATDAVSGATAFPYNLPTAAPVTTTAALLAATAAAPSASNKSPLFEPELKARDKVSELFALDESDALPGLYPNIHKVTAEKPIEDVPEKTTTTRATPTVATAAATTTVPFLSPARNVSASPPAVTAPAPASNPAPAPAPVAKPAPAAKPATIVNPPPSSNTFSTVHDDLLSDLLSPLPGDEAGPHASQKRAASLFGSSPPLSPFGSTSVAARSKAARDLFDLEDDEASILLPSAHQFKENKKTAPTANKPFPAPPTAAAAAATTTTARARNPLFDDDDDDDALGHPSWMPK